MFSPALRPVLLVALAALGLTATGQAQTDPRAKLFVQRGCSDCHAISALRVKALSDVGPDLTYAYVDVIRRYGLNLETFMSRPTGVMRLLFISHISLTVEERDSIVAILRGIYTEGRADAANALPTPGARPWR
jgi:hypothetical protein